MKEKEAHRKEVVEEAMHMSKEKEAQRKEAAKEKEAQKKEAAKEKEAYRKEVVEEAKRMSKEKEALRKEVAEEARRTSEEEKAKEKEAKKRNNRRGRSCTKSLSAEVIFKKWISSRDAELMRNREACTGDSNLALAFYHCCGTNPKSHVCNDKSLINDKTEVINRIKANFPKPCDAGTKLNTNKILNGFTCKAQTFLMCASCNEIIYHQSYSEKATTTPIESLCNEFRVPQCEIDSMRQNRSECTMRNHF